MLCISDIMTSQLQDGRSISFVASVFSPDRRHTLIVTTAAEGGSARAPARRESRRAPSTLLPRHLLKTNSPSSRLLGGGGGGGRGLIFTCMNIFSARLDCSKGGSGARDGRGGEAGARRGNCGPTRTPLSLSLSLRFVDRTEGDLCSFNSCCLPTNYKAEGGHFLPSDAWEGSRRICDESFCRFYDDWVTPNKSTSPVQRRNKRGQAE